MRVFSLRSQLCPVQMPAEDNAEGIESRLWSRGKPFTAADSPLQAPAVSHWAVKVRWETTSFQSPAF